ncbi:MAG TPA: chromosome partitioning protein ParA [Streptosporangiaceae bacterium]|nr:chromosome partitioning protein ParA [Streptosporangiaceae bacterium]
MTEDAPRLTGDVDANSTDVVGGRVLTGIQLINISRLSAHPVPMVSGGLVTVAGQGPKDSNGAGKSSFIAGISLLSGDEQWRWSSGAPDAAELLFTAEIAAADGRWGNADHGYVIGVFTEHGAASPEALAASALTVWLRINRKAPYIDLRWAHELYVPAAASDADRVAAADGMWAELPRHNGRHDIHANRLGEVLYGRHVRCVSFLSTSVRASATANLLAQPLNELSPARIFDAIAALTGVDREMETERASRTTEHARREEEQRARADLEQWEAETRIIEGGIAQRAQARAAIERAGALWQSRCARMVVDGEHELAGIGTEIGRLAADWDERAGQVARLREQLRELQNDEAFQGYCTAAERRWKEMSERDRALEVDERTTVRDIEDKTRQRTALLEQARAADGRDAADAVAEEAAANTRLEEALQACGARQHELTDAETARAGVEQGDDLAAGQLQRLRAAGLPAVPLLDSVVLAAGQRATWEPRLYPYREAVVVAHADAARARELLADLPGSTLVLADADAPAAPKKSRATKSSPAPEAPQSPTADGLPASPTGPPLTGFLSSLAERAGDPAEATDTAARVWVAGGFASPLTGHAARVEKAEARVTAATSRLHEAEEAVRQARSQLSVARARITAANAAQQAEQIWQDVTGLRDSLGDLAAQRAELEPAVRTARQEHAEMLAAVQTRSQQADRLRADADRLEDLQQRNATTRADLTTRQAAIDLQGRLTAFGGTVDEARAHLLALPGDQGRWSEQEWTSTSCAELDEVLTRCFPRGTPDEEIPREIAGVRADVRWSRGAAGSAEAFPVLHRSLRTYLAQTEQEDEYQRQRISRQRAERSADLEAARKGLREARQAAAAHRASVAEGIKAKLKKVAAQFDRLDQEYGGYGATLDFPEPEPPAEPDKPWRWTVTPKWRRAEGQRMAPYNLRGNTAQMDEKAVKLVCAAALAGGTERPLLLILDELGRNLGKQHRTEAVALFERIGRDRNITVIGALQDDMERYAIDASGLYVKLRRSSDASPYNSAPIVTGHDDNRARLALLHDWLAGHYPPLPSTESPDGDSGSSSSVGAPTASGVMV